MAGITPAALAQGSATAATPAPADNPAAGRVLAFDVISIKPVPPGGEYGRTWFGLRIYPYGLRIADQNVRQLIQYAYGVARLPTTDQITGLPEWATSQGYDIEAKMSDEDIAEFQKLDHAGQEQWHEEMMQALLADRFQLRIRRGTRQAPIYEMVVAKAGPRLQDAATDTGALRLGKNDDGSTYSGFQYNLKNTIAQQLSMATLAHFLSSSRVALGRPVVDKTGLTGTYNFALDWSIYPPANEGTAGTMTSDPGPSIFNALEKIGLKLQPTTGTLDTIVADHIERPSEN